LRSVFYLARRVSGIQSHSCCWRPRLLIKHTKSLCIPYEMLCFDFTTTHCLTSLFTAAAGYQDFIAAFPRGKEQLLCHTTHSGILGKTLPRYALHQGQLLAGRLSCPALESLSLPASNDAITERPYQAARPLKVCLTISCGTLPRHNVRVKICLIQIKLVVFRQIHNEVERGDAARVAARFARADRTGGQSGWPTGGE
jgi:hypothetical protein